MDINVDVHGPCNCPLSHCRVSLPDPWCGLRDKQLSQLTGIPGCVFVHANGFIGGNETYSGVLQMAAQALESKNS